MTQREIKFRALYKDEFVYFVIGQPWTDYQQNVYSDLCLQGAKFYQYTGLKDRNGVEIYGGDIIRISSTKNQIQRKSIVSEIGFMSGAFCALWRITEIWEGYNVAPSSVVFLNCIDQIEVIGNVSQNPELLKP